MQKRLWIVNHYAIPPAYGGLNRHYYFSKYLRDLGYETKIFTSAQIHNSDINFTEKGRLFVEKSVDDIPYTFIKGKNYKGNGIGRIFSFLSFPYFCRKAMKKFLKEERPDVIYASSPELFSTFMAIKFGKKYNIPVVVEIRDLWPESIVHYSSFTEKNLIIKCLYRLERYIYQKASRIIYTFEGGRDYISDKRWDVGKDAISLKKVYNINNGVDLPLFEMQAGEYIYPDDVLDKSNKFNVLYTGSIRRVNRVDMLIDAMKLINEKGYSASINLILYGDGTEKGALIEKCKEHNLNNVFFRDRIDKKYIAGILRRSDLNVFVGEHDSLNRFGLSLNKIFDYMAAGKPILGNMESAYDNVLKYDCGKIVAEEDIEALAGGILYFFNLSSEQYDKYCENSLKAAKEFDYKAHTEKLYDILEGAIEDATE